MGKWSRSWQRTEPRSDLPALRPQYHENYYGAYFRDTEGNKVCLVCHDPM